jgi:hypothetical protein
LQFYYFGLGTTALRGLGYNSSAWALAEQELNQTCNTAQNLTTATFPVTLSANLDSSIKPDADFFKFKVTPGATLKIKLTGVGNPILDFALIGLFDSQCQRQRDADTGQLNFTVPTDGVFIIAIAQDYEFLGGGNGGYQLDITPYQAIGSISGQVFDAASQQPIPYDPNRFQSISLYRCNPVCTDSINVVDIAHHLSVFQSNREPW